MENKITDRYTNIVTERQINIPIYISFAGGIMMLQLSMSLQLQLFMLQKLHLTMDLQLQLSMLLQLQFFNVAAVALIKVAEMTVGFIKEI